MSLKTQVNSWILFKKKKVNAWKDQELGQGTEPLHFRILRRGRENYWYFHMRPGEMVTSKANIGVGQVGLLIPIYTGAKRKN